MGRHGYTDDCDDELQFGRWRGQVASAIRGKRGQAFLRELIAALEAMPQKKLITNDLVREDGNVCTLGAVGVAKGINVAEIDPYDHETLADKFNIATQLVQEIEWENDENCGDPEERWRQMLGWAKRHLIEDKPEEKNKQGGREEGGE